MTIEKFPDTPQALFEVAATALLTMTRRCIDEEGVCLYRVGHNPKADERCPIGACIPDSCYSATMENKTGFQIITTYPETLGLSSLSADELGKLGNVANALQIIHDQEDGWADRSFYVRQVAGNHGLTITPAIEALLTA